MDDNAKYWYVFGPVPSRRLGRSLGVDLVPSKTCSFDCIYCQLGPTSNKTASREMYVPVADVLAELGRRLDAGPRPDYVTLSGSGEPTLHAGLADILAGIRRLTDVPVAVLTNGSLFYQPEVRTACARADLVIPSLDAPNPALFERINRPCPEITFRKLVDGLDAFRDEYEGQIWLEVFLIDGLNTGPKTIEEFKRLFERILPDTIQLNTAVRPTAEENIAAVPDEVLRGIAEAFGERAQVIADRRGVHRRLEFKVQRNDVLDMLRRRPCSVQDIARGLGIHVNEAVKHIGELETDGAIVPEHRDEALYYRAVGEPDHSS